MKLLVVGGSSFIGRNFLKTANLTGYDVTATYSSDAYFPKYLKSIKPQFKSLRYNFLTDEIDFSRFDIALYLAGNSNHGWAGANPDTDLQMNGVAMAKFLKTFRGRIIFFSSGAVYFGKSGLVSPEVTPDPHFPYAISKLVSELYIKWARESGLIRSYTILRFYYAFGSGEEDRRLIRKLLTQFLSKDSEEFSVNGDGKSLMSPMYIGDVVRAIESVLKKEREGVYDLPAAQNYTVSDIIKLAGKVSDIRPKIMLKPTSEAPLRFYSRQAKFAKDFGFKQRYTLEEGLRLYKQELQHETTR